MRSLFFIPTILLVATPAMAQTSAKPTQSADEIVCKLFNECGAKTYSADQKFDKAKSEQDFTFVPHAAKTTSRPVVSRVPVSTPKNGYIDNRTARARPAPVVGNRPGMMAAGATGPSAGVAARADMRVNFRSGSAILTPQGQIEAQEFAKALMMPMVGTRRVRIEGHTDAVGTRSDNLVLSHARAEAVANFLVAQGVKRDRLDAVGYGFDRPLNSKVLTSPVNRRVEIVVIP